MIATALHRVAPTHRGRWWAGCLAVLLAAGGCSSSDDTRDTGFAPATISEELPLAFAPASLSWESCGGRLQCASLECGDQLAEWFLTVDLAPVDAEGHEHVEREASDRVANCDEADRALLRSTSARPTPSRTSRPSASPSEATRSPTSASPTAP